MEDVKLEFPSLPQCKEDAEVSLSVTNTHRPQWLFAEGRTPGPSRRSFPLLLPLLPPEGVSGPRGGHCCRGFSLVESRGYSSLLCTGFSLWWLLLLQSMGRKHHYEQS